MPLVRSCESRESCQCGVTGVGSMAVGRGVVDAEELGACMERDGVSGWGCGETLARVWLQGR